MFRFMMDHPLVVIAVVAFLAVNVLVLAWWAAAFADVPDSPRLGPFDDAESAPTRGDAPASSTVPSSRRSAA